MTNLRNEFGIFALGCNYWASNAGCHMWEQWAPETVEKDIAALAALKIQWLRVFPVWTVFQPLSVVLTAGGERLALTWKNEEPLPVDGHTVDPEMLKRLRFLCDCAQSHGLKLIVSLVTGWMSGELFVPPAFAQRNLFSDAETVFYEVQMVREIVSALKDHPAVAMWEPGNECNCMSRCTERYTARLWLDTITTAIRSADPSRPIAAGMHGMVPASAETERPSLAWVASDLGESCDYLTTHPYPLFTPYAETDPLGSFKSVFHATAESRFYADLSGKPCFAEELGTLAPVVAGEALKAQYLKRTMANLLFHDCQAMMWWCGFDQGKLTRAPYRYCAVERELGLIRDDGTVKPVGQALTAFAERLATLPFQTLPPYEREACVVLTHTDTAWRSAWGAFLLAKQAGFDVEFHFMGNTLPDKKLYIVPSVSGNFGLSSSLCQDLEKKAQEGAIVFLSYDDAMLSPFSEGFGIESSGRSKGAFNTVVHLDGEELAFPNACRLEIQTQTGTKVLLQDDDGRVLLTGHHLGAGEMNFFTLPLEKIVTETSGAARKGYWKIYQMIAQPVLESRPVGSALPELTVTIHLVDEDHCYAAVVNNDQLDRPLQLTLAPEWQLIGPAPAAKLAAGDFTVLTLTRK